MRIYSQYIIFGAATGVLALGGVHVLPGQPQPSAARAAPRAIAQQDTSTAKYDTSKGRYDTSATTKKSKKKGQHRGAATDTALRAKPGVQTGPTDSMKMKRSTQGDSMRDSTR